MANRAQVDLMLGEPSRRPAADQPSHEYAPAKGDADSARILIQFDADTQHVARLDAYLKGPVAAATLRERFGTLILSRDRNDGGREEFFYPQLFGLILAGRNPDAPVIAVSYLSPRTIGGIYARRSSDRLAAKSFDEARTDADKAVAIDPDGAEGYLVQGHLLLAQRDDDEALVRYTAAAAARYGPADRFQAQLAIARVYEDRKNWPDKAAAAYQAAIAMAPPADRGHARIAYAKFLINQKKTEEALAEYGRAADADPANRQVRAAVAEALWALKEFVRALPHYAVLSQHADTFPEFPQAALMHFRFGYAQAEAGRTAEAVKAYEKIVSDPKLGPLALNNLGVLAQRAGDWSNAVEFYSRAVRADTKNVLANHNLARGLIGAGRFDEARRQAEATWALDSKNAEIAFTVARSWGALRKKRETLHWLNAAVTGGFNDQARLTTDPHLAFIQNDSAFRKLLLTVR